MCRIHLPHSSAAFIRRDSKSERQPSLTSIADIICIRLAAQRNLELAKV
jgi:hypothetical protein